ncbi:transposase [Prosthecomicrobium hirschii]|uniref:transposase n=1 Tax=Prosthecodimorpha hirschii TaxID=665126 RepID=UPI0009FA3419|nr:transposase [Prosthecomicrobium hirschii]
MLAKNTVSGVWADTAYRSQANEKHLAERGLTSKIHFRGQPRHDLAPSQRKANRARSKVRSGVKGVFADQKCALGLIVRTIGLARATTKIALANLTYNFRCYLWLAERPKTA